MHDAVRLEGVSFAYGSQQVLQDVSLSIPGGAFVTLLGPSGCGKSTLLKLIGGYLTPSRGQILIGSSDVTLQPARERNIGMVFQSYALFPHLSARKNVAFGLEVRGVSKATIKEQVEVTLDRVGLLVDERDRYPSELSGGQQQRVALARALAFGPPVLLLDEPLSSLDRQLREQTRAELRRVHLQSKVSTLMVTHDQTEALAISDFMGIMRAGRLLQFGTPREIYERPLSPFIARFLGEASLIPGECLGLNRGMRLVRPEHIQPGNDFVGTVIAISFRGADLLVELQCRDFKLKLICGADMQPSIGHAMSVAIPREVLWTIPEGNGES